MDNKIKRYNMKRNSKALYEQIMRNVSREIKKSLNENDITDDYETTLKFAEQAIREIFYKEDTDQVFIDEEYSDIGGPYYMSAVYIDSYRDNVLTIEVSESYPEDPEYCDQSLDFDELEINEIDPNMVYLAVRNQFGGDYEDIERKYRPYIG